MKSPSHKTLKPLRSSLKPIDCPVDLLLEKIKALDTTFWLADEALLDNNRISAENVLLKQKVLLLEKALKDSKQGKSLSLTENGEIEIIPDAETMQAIKESFDSWVKLIGKSAAHWKKQTNDLMTKYYPIIKELKSEQENLHEENSKLWSKLNKKNKQTLD